MLKRIRYVCMDISELRKSTDKELQDMLVKKRDELRTLRFKASERQLKEVRRIRNVKQTIAQILTVIAERAKGVTAGKIQTQ